MNRTRLPVKKKDEILWTPYQAEEKMKDVYNGGSYDNEGAHGFADHLLCQLLRQLGYGKMIDVYEKLEKWYA